MFNFSTQQTNAIISAVTNNCVQTFTNEEIEDVVNKIKDTLVKFKESNNETKSDEKELNK